MINFFIVSYEESRVEELKDESSGETKDDEVYTITPTVDEDTTHYDRNYICEQTLVNPDALEKFAEVNVPTSYPSTEDSANIPSPLDDTEDLTDAYTGNDDVDDIEEASNMINEEEFGSSTVEDNEQNSPSSEDQSNILDGSDLQTMSSENYEELKQLYMSILQETREIKNYIVKETYQIRNAVLERQKNFEEQLSTSVSKRIGLHLQKSVDPIVKTVTTKIVSQVAESNESSLISTLENEYLPAMKDSVESSLNEILGQLAQNVEKVFKQQFSQVLAPSFEKTSVEMLSQLTNHFNSGIEKYKEHTERAFNEAKNKALNQ